MIYVLYQNGPFLSHNVMFIASKLQQNMFQQRTPLCSVYFVLHILTKNIFDPTQSLNTNTHTSTFIQQFAAFMGNETKTLRSAKSGDRHESRGAQLQDFYCEEAAGMVFTWKCWVSPRSHSLSKVALNQDIFILSITLQHCKRNISLSRNIANMCICFLLFLPLWCYTANFQSPSGENTNCLFKFEVSQSKSAVSSFWFVTFLSLENRETPGKLFSHF